MKAFFISLGCPKNLCDTEVLMGKLAASGYEITTTEKDADIYIVNTCAFLKSAREESLSEIRRLLKYKKPVYAAGCLPKLRDLKLEIRDSKFAGTIDSIALPSYCVPRIKATPPWTAYVKIAEGCNNHCSYCLIPRIRGRLRTRKAEDVIKEVQDLANRGVKEIIFVAQDTTAHPKLPEILKCAAKIDGIHWVRLLYAHPGHISDKLIKLLAREKKICKYLDLPVQHVSKKMLKAMNRPLPGGKDLLDLIKRVRRLAPRLALRTSLIAGFPGETKNDFEELLAFIKEVKFDRLGCFGYSREPGTPAAKLKGQISSRVKQERAKKIMRAQKKISRRLNRKMIGKTIEVLIEKKENGSWIGRTYKDSPEIDPIVRIKDAKTSFSLAPGNFVKAKIVSARDYDLVAEIPT